MRGQRPEQLVLQRRPTGLRGLVDQEGHGQQHQRGRGERQADQYRRAAGPARGDQCGDVSGRRLSQGGGGGRREGALLHRRGAHSSCACWSSETAVEPSPSWSIAIVPGLSVESAGMAALAALPGSSGYSKLSESAMIFCAGGEARNLMNEAAASLCLL